VQCSLRTNYSSAFKCWVAQSVPLVRRSIACTWYLNVLLLSERARQLLAVACQR
jgi:hypothetical protein